MDAGAWILTCGWALSMAVIGLPYYLDQNPVLVEQARRVLDAVRADPA